MEAVLREYGPMEQILALILDVGEMMLTSGAEVNRVEDTIQRMATAYGCSRVDVLTITSSIIVTVQRGQEEIITQTRRILSYLTDMQRIEECNALSRQVCREPLPIAELSAGVEHIRSHKRYPEWVQFLGYLLGSSTFAVFFGGDFLDAIAAALCSIVLFFLGRVFRRLRIQRIVISLLSAAAAGFSAAVLNRLGLARNMDAVCIGNIMLLISGMAFTTSLRDMISGDTISGLLGLCEAVLQALAIAAGFAVAMWTVGGGI